MPKKVLFSLDDFQFISRELERLGFRKIEPGEFYDRIRNLKFQGFRPKKGRETGFEFRAKSLVVTVWTTWLEEEGNPRDSDEGWIAITSESGRRLYFSHPLHRTRNFVVNLLMQARIARWRVKNRPSCSQCGEPMNIAGGRRREKNQPRCPECGELMEWERQGYWICYGNGEHKNRIVWDYNSSTRSRYWACYNRNAHKNRIKVTLDWDTGLPPKAKKYAVKLRKRRAKYRQGREKQGKSVNQAYFQRRRSRYGY